MAASTSTVATPSTPPVATPGPTPQRTYVVQQGDTLNELAQRFGTTAAAIRAANGLTGDTINVGQVLVIP
ncbi:MAG: LysM peptidoglycan-binding domain-containing protein [Chloroflexi bacterium]|nr:LysM peptidoglycan-binding domain-containing protein [Chloroflexota bacterium]